ncbi:MAG: D-alanine--D-alanine ligase, partial [Pseudomonadota bacterium]
MLQNSVNQLTIALLCGGKSKERQVSLDSGKAIAASLEKLSYNYHMIDPDDHLIDNLLKLKPDLVFNALHGTYGEDGRIQGLLDIMQIPYTHSGVLSSALAFNKKIAKDIFTANNINCPKGMTVSIKELFAQLKAKNYPIKPPFVIKPLTEGSSLGVYIVDDKFDFVGSNIETDWKFGTKAIIEQYIAGKEISVAVLNGKSLGAIEIVPVKGFYSYDNKYIDGNAEHIYPAPVSKKIYDLAIEIAEKVHELFYCKNISRCDFRYDPDEGPDGTLYILELNTHPGMTNLSIVPKTAEHAG